MCVLGVWLMHVIGFELKTKTTFILTVPHGDWQLSVSELVQVQDIVVCRMSLKNSILLGQR